MFQSPLVSKFEQHLARGRNFLSGVLKIKIVDSTVSLLAVTKTSLWSIGIFYLYS